MKNLLFSMGLALAFFAFDANPANAQGRCTSAQDFYRGENGYLNIYNGCGQPIHCTVWIGYWRWVGSTQRHLHRRYSGPVGVGQTQTFGGMYPASGAWEYRCR